MEAGIIAPSRRAPKFVLISRMINCWLFCNVCGSYSPWRAVEDVSSIIEHLALDISTVEDVKLLSCGQGS
jgi:hypothetical protein